MADRKISQLNDGVSFQPGDEAVVNRSGANFKVDPTQFSGFDLTAISTSIADTAVDVFVYDTSRDSDGGAWRHRTQHTSWYNETLNTATRGSRREFPAVAVIVAEANQVTIYDGDDPSLPMWMVFNSGADATNETLLRYAAVEKVSALNAKMAVVTEDNRGLVVIDFIEESNLCYRGDNGVVYFVENANTLANRNDTYTEPTVKNASLAIVNNVVNDVAMTVLPNAPIDAATGLPVPTIAVGTDGGVSVIKDDGAVVDYLTAGSASTNVAFLESNRLGIWIKSATNSINMFCITNDSVGAYSSDQSNITVNANLTNYSANAATTPTESIYLYGAGFNRSWQFGKYAGGFFGANISGTGDGGFSLVAEDQATPANGMVAYTTSDYATGWMNGDIKLATLSDTDDTDLVEFEILDEFDSSAGWSLQDGFSITGGKLEWVAGTGREAAKTFTGLTVGRKYVASVDLETTTSPSFRIYSLDVGGSDYEGVGSIDFTFTAISSSILLRIRNAGPTGSATLDNLSIRLAEPDRSVNDNGLIINGTVTRTAVATGADLVAYSGFSDVNYFEQPYNSDLDFGTGDFCFMGWVFNANVNNAKGPFRRSGDTTNGRFLPRHNADGTLTVYVSTASSKTLTGPFPTSGDFFIAYVRESGVLKVYVDGVLVDSVASTEDITSIDQTETLRFGTGYSPIGDLALWRISATAPTAEQIAKIYEDEKFLFQEGAQATLYGSSDAVTALAHDEVTDLLHVGTSAGRSVFQGLRRVDNTTDAVGVAISAYDDLVVED